ncbi:aspartate aminotransferase family protein [Aureibacter tunicatorum]|uniref:Acetylornithine aminotransferase n=1 Tax=Aureibacter tunicatorum TaxID=866807 RepID=A0AAE4BR13_9BACT|nr:aminotransferase class III-fold pyridoxal phosphate-dependent enzyme [Aureibacter tunicatorum]MDR6239754.1 acetylornithine aminotransferase [Aureibacter tunicatorum]BDD04230.1 acetylornithine aminotransferase [Aureibacter tunicatorum]
MELYNVYPLWDITIEKGHGTHVYDTEGKEYLDFYGGHAVISIGHSHPKFVKSIQEQVAKLAFYSNSIQNPLQEKLASKLNQACGMDDYQLFLCNSGAEANENALKLASFETGRKKVIAFEGAFHGRTSAAVEATDNPKIIAPINDNNNVITLPLNDKELLEQALMTKKYAAVIIEGIQGINGITIPDNDFLKSVEELCRKYDSKLILDEVQSGYGRSGKFFSFQHAGIQPDIITIAKGMGNGFPIGGVLIHPNIKPWFGQLGTTFGGNHLACAAGNAVLDALMEENMIENAHKMGEYFHLKASEIEGIQQVRGKGLMLGLEFNYPVTELRKKLLFESKIFTGASKQNNIMRILPPLNIEKGHIDYFLKELSQYLS